MHYGNSVHMVTASICAASILAASDAQIVSRTLLDGKAGSPEARVIVNERILTKEGFALVSHSVTPGASPSYSIRKFNKAGEPLESSQEGYWNDKWNVFTTMYGEKQLEQSINGEVTKQVASRKAYRNPTNLWFWKTKPAPGTSETVKFVAQNVIQDFEIKFTYEGDEELEILGKKIKVHRVMERPLRAPEGVYTVWWYDDEGMGVKRHHQTTTGSFDFELIGWK